MANKEKDANEYTKAYWALFACIAKLDSDNAEIDYDDALILSNSCKRVIEQIEETELLSK